MSEAKQRLKEKLADDGELVNFLQGIGGLLKGLDEAERHGTTDESMVADVELRERIER